MSMTNEQKEAIKGEYVRTRQGIIFQATENIKINVSIPKKYEKFEDEITKHSFNIIDLLETDDIVVLEYYVEKYGKRIIRKFEAFKYDTLIKFNNIHCDFLYDLNEKKWTEEEYDIQIKQILTHEQFEANAYKVRGE